MFSIVIPYYKKRKYIERCINSVLSQTFQDFEIILVDDGSDDDISSLVIERYKNKIKLIQQINQGVSVARNVGIENAKNDYIAFLDADDCWNARYLEFTKKIIDENTDVKIIGSHYTRNHSIIKAHHEKLNYIKFQNYFKEAVKNTYFTSSSSVIFRDFFLKNKGFNPGLKRGEDIDVWLRTVASGGNAFFIQNTMVYYSDEDINQATASIGRVENSLVGIINDYYNPLIKEVSSQYFSTFISKYVYFNLYPYFFNSENHIEARKSLSKNKNYYFFLHLPYYIPFKIGQRIVSNKKLNRYLRLYLKFFLRKIYL